MEKQHENLKSSRWVDEERKMLYNTIQKHKISSFLSLLFVRMNIRNFHRELMFMNIKAFSSTPTHNLSYSPPEGCLHLNFDILYNIKTKA